MGEQTSWKQKGNLSVAGRILEIACRRKAKRLGIERYTWAQLALDSGTSETAISRAAQQEQVQHPRPETVKKWWDVFSDEDAEFRRMFFHAFGYAAPDEVEQVGLYVEQLELLGE